MAKELGVENIAMHNISNMIQPSTALDKSIKYDEHQFIYCKN
jgi:hypothetical protein